MRPSMFQRPPGQTRFDIDALRGVVCLSLVALHFYQNGPLREQIERMVGAAGVFAIMHVRLGVESFFLLAGVMMAHVLKPVPGEDVSIGGYLKRRFYRLIIPYWIAVGLAALDRHLIGLVIRTQRQGPTLGEVSAQLTLTQELFGVQDAAPGYWSLVSLEQFYLLFLACMALCWRLFGKSHGVYGRAERALSWIALAICLASGAVLLFDVQIHFELARNAMYLALGILLYWAVCHGFARAQFAVGVLALAVVAVAAVLSMRSRPLAALLGLVLLTPLCLGHSLPDWPVVRALRFWGRRSYSLYLVHAIVGIRVLTFQKVLPDREWVTALLLVAAFAASLVGAELFFRFVERPWHERARRVEFRRREASGAAGRRSQLDGAVAVGSDEIPSSVPP